MDHFFVPDHAVPMRELFHTNVAASFGHHLLLGNDVAGGKVGEGCGDVGVKAAFLSTIPNLVGRCGRARAFHAGS